MIDAQRPLKLYNNFAELKENFEDKIWNIKTVHTDSCISNDEIIDPNILNNLCQICGSTFKTNGTFL